VKIGTSIISITFLITAKQSNYLVPFHLLPHPPQVLFPMLNTETDKPRLLLTVPATWRTTAHDCKSGPSLQMTPGAWNLAELAITAMCRQAQK
jgi:hypothetical protein